MFNDGNTTLEVSNEIEARTFMASPTSRPLFFIKDL